MGDAGLDFEGFGGARERTDATEQLERVRARIVRGNGMRRTERGRDEGPGGGAAGAGAGGVRGNPEGGPKTLPPPRLWGTLKAGGTGRPGGNGERNLQPGVGEGVCIAIGGATVSAALVPDVEDTRWSEESRGKLSLCGTAGSVWRVQEKYCLRAKKVVVRETAACGDFTKPPDTLLGGMFHHQPYGRSCSGVTPREMGRGWGFGIGAAGMVRRRGGGRGGSGGGSSGGRRRRSTRRRGPPRGSRSGPGGAGRPRGAPPRGGPGPGTKGRDTMGDGGWGTTGPGAASLRTTRSDDGGGRQGKKGVGAGTPNRWVPPPPHTAVWSRSSS